MLPGGIGITELIVVLVIVLVIFGPKRLPGMGKALGGGIREFKNSVTGGSKHDDEDDDVDERGLPAAEAVATPEASREDERPAEVASDRTA